MIFIERSGPCVVEAKAGKPPKIRAIIGVGDEINGNQRFYPVDILSREVERLQSQIRDGQCIGNLDHPENSAQGKLSEACVKWNRVWMAGNRVMGEGELLGTSSGSDVAALLAANVPVEVSSRGTGSTVREIRDGKPCDVIQPDFELLGWDLVQSGSTGGTEVKLVESQRARQLTAAQQRMQQLAGILSESGVFRPEDGAGGAGIVSDTSYEISDQPGSVAATTAPEPSFEAKLAAAVLQQKKRTVDAISPLQTDVAWVCFEPATKTMLSVSFSRSADGSIKILSIENLDDSTAQAAQTYRSVVAARIAGMQGTATESRESFVMTILRENQEFIQRRAGVIA